jgi:hypothetical protein
MARMIRRLRLMIAVGLVAAVAVLVPPHAAGASPKAAHAVAAATATAAATDVTEGTDCHYGAFGSGTVVHICASIHWRPFQAGVGGAALPAGAARHTKGPGPVTLYVTALRIYDATTGKLLNATSRNNLGVDYVSEVGDGWLCEIPLPTHITFQAAFGIDAYLPGHTTPTHITQYSGKVTHSHCAA